MFLIRLLLCDDALQKIEAAMRAESFICLNNKVNTI